MLAGMTIRPFPEGTPGERKYGFTRVVRVGDVIHCSGTTAASITSDVPPTAYDQVRTIFGRLLPLIERAGGMTSTVYKVRAFALAIADTAGILQAMSDALDGSRPSATLVEVSGLASPGALVEIEIEALAVTDPVDDE
jgi:enamine deaminase RidA (YjgF/YER057c/UK114 family)